MTVAYSPDWTLDPAAETDRRCQARLPGEPEQPLGHRARARARSPRWPTRLDCPLVVDEAYVDFAATDCVGLVCRRTPT